MPIYEYVCTECGADTEVLQKISEPAPAVCAQCGAPGLKKKVTAAAFRLKGGGWYETDFKSDGKRNLADGKADTDSGKSEKSGSTDTKPEASKDSKSADSGTAKSTSDKPAAKAAKPKPASPASD